MDETDAGDLCSHSFKNHWSILGTASLVTKMRNRGLGFLLFSSLYICFCYSEDFLLAVCVRALMFSCTLSVVDVVADTVVGVVVVRLQLTPKIR